MKTQVPGRKANGRLKIKVEQATCDACRQSGVVCQAPDSVDERCGQCEELGLACTWKIGPRPMGRSPPSPSYIAYLEAQVGKLERKLREVLPGVNLNRELETLAQGPASPPRQRPIYIHLRDSPPSTSPQQPTGGPTPFQHTQDLEPPVLHSAPQLLKQVRLASEVETETPLPYSKQKQGPRDLREDTYWSATASTNPDEPRFHGQSSGEILLRDAKEIKREFVELSLGAYERKHEEQARGYPGSLTQRQPIASHGSVSDAHSSTSLTPQIPIKIRVRRAKYWEPTGPEQRSLALGSWSRDRPIDETHESSLSEVRLPPPDLVRELVRLFFEYIAPFLPVLHRGTFERDLEHGSHLLQILQRRAHEEKRQPNPGVTSGNSDYNHTRAQTYGYGYPGSGSLETGDSNCDQRIDPTRGAGSFARVVLLVCACASKWSNDPRVLWAGNRANSGREADNGNNSNRTTPSLLSAGYDFFREIGSWRWTTCAQPSLWDVQISILSALFLHGSCDYYGAWIVLGVGIRQAQDVGAHRRKEGISLANELYKRSFWSLLVLERLMCGSLGRPSAMQDLDSDLENLIEVDDECWTVDGEPAQQPGKPSRLAHFNCMIGLCRVLGRALQTVFALDRTRKQMGLVGYEKEEQLIADLQRHMEQWRRTVPYHLQLPPPGQFIRSVFLDQAVQIFTIDWCVTDLTPFARTQAKFGLNLPGLYEHTLFVPIAECLNICRTSARACAKLLEGHLQSRMNEVLPCAIQPAFSSAMVLLVDILATRRAKRLKSPAGAEGTSQGWPTTEDWYPEWEKEMDIETCRKTLEQGEMRWHVAGQLHDTIREFQHSIILLTKPNASATATSPPGPPGPRSTDDTEQTAPPASRNDRRAFPADATLSNPPLTSGSWNDVIIGTGPDAITHGEPSAAISSVPHGHDSRGANIHPTITSYDTYYPTYISAPPDAAGPLEPGPMNPHLFDSSVCLPDAYYGDNTNVLFPGLQFTFAPNQGREDIGYQESVREETLDPEWPNAVPRPTVSYQWEQLIRNTWNMAGDFQPPS